jgi:dipeptidyl aminopeptidase/acylaminoacyl peptidase
VNNPNSATGLPPLIDREVFFGNPEIAGAQLSPDGKYVAFLKPYKDTRNIWVKKVEEPFSAARLLTKEEKRPIPGFFWTRDSKFLIYSQDKDGDENFNVYAVSHLEENPAARDLTGVSGAQVQIYSLPKSDPDLAFIGLNDRDKAWHDLYRLKISTGEKTLVRQNTDQIASWIFDLQGNLRLAFRTKQNGDQEILRVDSDKFTPIYSCGVFETCAPVRFHKDGKRFYMETNKGDLNLSSLMLMDAASGSTTLVESDPEKRVDFGAAIFSEVSDELVATSYTDAKTRRYFRDKALEADYKWLQAQFPGREVGLGSSSKDENFWLVIAYSDTEPGETHFFDRKAKKLTFQYRVRENLPRTSLSEMKPIAYKSSDGLEIPAYLTLPKGLEAKKLPLIVVPHGGPWARDTWGYNGMAQFLANRGYAVLMPNFRGSTGYGKAFLNAGNGEWGRKMQDDITWGVKHLVAEGIADPKRVGIMGGSYGGYATLAGLAFTPDVYRAGVDIVGPSNLVTLLESVPPYWESFRKILYARMADLDTPEGKAWLKERSPLNQADKIKTPLLVVQGANDPRVKQAEADQIVIALRERKFPVEYIVAPDEGHGFARPVNNMAMYMAVEKFLAMHLDGRYQEGGTPEVVARLKEITVDPATVKLAPKVDASAVGLPAVAHNLAAATRKYNVKISAGGQEMALAMTSSIAQESGNWLATETLEGPMGKVVDTALLHGKTLALAKRSYEQGPVKVEIQYSPTKASGKMSMGGQERPLDAEIGGEVFADGPAALEVMAALPLAEGYKTTFRRFDLQSGKPKLMQLAVSGTSAVEVPAGKFEAWVIDVSSAEGGPDKSTVYIDKATRTPVKMEAVLPAMGGAKMVSELLP